MSLYGSLSGALQSRGQTSGENPAYPPPPPPANSLPYGTITSPTADQVVTVTPFPVTADLQDDDGFVTQARLSVNGTFTAVDTMSPWEISYDFADGANTVFVEITDNDGAVAYTPSIVFSVDTAPPPPPPPPTAPEVRIIGNGLIITNGSATTSVTDGTDFGSVEQGGAAVAKTFLVNNLGDANLVTSSMTVPSGYTVTDALAATIAPISSDTFTVEMSTASIGTYSGNVSFTTNDSDENPAFFAITGEVAAAPPPPPPPPPPSVPTITIASPADGGTSTAVPVAGSATATAVSPASSIAQVEFFVNGASVSTDSSGPPWTFSLDAPNGTYSIYGVATDNLGGTAQSTAVTHTISVAPPAGTEQTRIAFSNEGGSALPAHSVSRMFGMSYREGVFAAGDMPQFQLADGTAVPANIMQPSYWPDGSLAFASHIIRPTVGIAAAARTFTISGTTITAANHTGLTNGDPCIVKSTAVMRQPFKPYKLYYVRLGTGTTITLHATQAAAVAGTGAILPSVVAGEAGSGTFTLEPAIEIVVKTGGSTPSASALSTSTISANADLKVTLDGLIGMSGAWTSSVNTGISDGGVNVATFGTGPCGVVYRIYQELNNGSSDHAQAGAFHYVQALQNNVGGLHGLRYYPELVNGWHEVTSPQISTYGIDNVKAMNGATELAAPTTGFATKNFTASGSAMTASSVFQAEAPSSTGNTDWPDLCPVVLSNSGGALPTGLTAGVGYWARCVLGTTAFTLHATYAQATTNTSAIVTSSAGTGTHTLTMKPWLVAYSGGQAVVGTDGEYIFLAGTAGTGAETTGVVTPDIEYLFSCRTSPPYRVDLPVEALTARTYTMCTAHEVPYGGQSGPNPTMGPFDSFTVRGLRHNNNRATVRQHIAALHHVTPKILRKDTMNPLNISTTTFANMGSQLPEYTYFPGNATNSFFANLPDSLAMPHGAASWSHRPSFQRGAYWRFGEPQMLDLAIASANSGLASEVGLASAFPHVWSFRGQATHAGVSRQYYNALTALDAERKTAWITMDFALLACIASNSWNGAPIKDYAKSILTNDGDYTTDLKSGHSTFAKSIDMPPLVKVSDSYMVWQGSFLIGSKLWAWLATRDADIRADIEGRYAHFDKIRTTWGLHYVDTFYQGFVNGGAATSWDQGYSANTFGATYYTASNDTVEIQQEILIGSVSQLLSFSPFTGTITGGTSGHTAKIRGYRQANGGAQNYLRISAPTGIFTLGETITGSPSGSSVVNSHPVATYSIDGFGPIANGVSYVNWGHKGAVPGITSQTTYYVRDWDPVAMTFKLSTNSSLSDIVDITSDFYISDPNGTGGYRAGGTDVFQSDYLNDMLANAGALVNYMKFAAAVGITFPGTFYADLRAAYGAGPGHTSNTAYHFQDTYTYS